MKILGIVGTRRSGKTTTITMLIEELKKRGYKVGTIKTINCPVFSMDDPKSNTARHKKAGADFAVARGKGETDISFPRSMDQNEVIERIKGEDIDYLILEGDLSASVPRIVCAHTREDAQKRITEKTFLVSGKIADTMQTVCGLPAVSAFKDISALCDMVMEKVNDTEIPIQLNEDTSANTLNCMHACENDRKSTPSVLRDYDFDKEVNRKDTNSVKWDLANGALPMWIADMDFEAPPAVKREVLKKALEGVYGYTCLPAGWHEAYISWWDRRHGLKICENELFFAKSVLAAISSAVKSLTKNGAQIVLLSPVYNHFYKSISNNNRKISESRLVYDGNEYTIDFEELEKKLADEQSEMIFLCNPHNPTGRIWTFEELERISFLCKKHNVTVLADEIHCDITKPGKKYTPFAVANTAGAAFLTCMAPTKAFNLAGLDSAAVFVKDDNLKQLVKDGLIRDEVAGANAFAATAAVAAFNEGEGWINDLNAYIYENIEYACDYFKSNIPDIKPVDMEATYLMWVNISKYGVSSKEFSRIARDRCGVYVTPGDEYGSGGEGFIRINVATQRKRLEKGLECLKKVDEILKKEDENV